MAFWVRDHANAGKKRVERLSADAFTGQSLLHALPQGFKRIRHYRLLASCHKRKKLAAYRAALDVPDPVKPMIEAVDAFMQHVVQIDITRCTHCEQGTFHVIENIAPKRAPMPPPSGPPP